MECINKTSSSLSVPNLIKMADKPRLEFVLKKPIPNSTELVIIDNQPGSHSTTQPALIQARSQSTEAQETETRLEGSLVLHLPPKGPVPKEIELRFVSGVVSKFEDAYEEIFLRGTDRVFDHKVTLYQANGPLSSQPLQPGQSHTFHFGLHLPQSSPPTCKNTSVHTQYVLAAATYFEGGCCWGWVPAFTPDPCLARQEMSVRRVMGPLAQLRQLDKRVTSIGQNLKYHPISSEVDTGNQLLILTDRESSKDDSKKESFFGHLSVEWTPFDGVSLRVPGCLSKEQAFVPMEFSMESDACQELSISLIQHQKLHFKYNVDPSRSFESPYTAIRFKDKQDRLDLYTAQFENIPQGSSETLWIPHGQPLAQANDLFLEYMDTKPATVMHYFKITLKTEKEGNFETQIPVIVYVPPLMLYSDFEGVDIEEDNSTVFEMEGGVSREVHPEKVPLLVPPTWTGQNELNASVPVAAEPLSGTPILANDNLRQRRGDN